MERPTVLLSPMCNGFFIKELEQEFTGDYFELIGLLGKIFNNLVMTDSQKMYAIKISDLNSELIFYYESGNIYNQFYRQLRPVFQFEFSDN